MRRARAELRPRRRGGQPTGWLREGALAGPSVAQDVRRASFIGAATPALANEWATFAKSRGSNASTLSRAASAIAAKSSGASTSSATEKAQAVFARCLAAKFSILSVAAAAISANSPGARTRAFENDHAKEARFCGLNAASLDGVASSDRAISEKSAGAGSPAVAKAQHKFAWSCGAKASTWRAAVDATAAKSFGSSCLAVA